MQDPHIPIVRLQVAAEELAEGLRLNPKDSEHLRNCPDCRKMLTTLIRHSATAGSMIFRSIGPEHLPIRQLWDYARGIEIDTPAVQHLTSCKDCLGVVKFCRSEPSFHQL